MQTASTVDEMYTRLQSATERAQQRYEGEQQPFALYLPAIGALHFERISTIARALVRVHRKTYHPDQPYVLVTEQNCAKSLGQRIDALTDASIPLVVVDELSPTERDYLDVGTPLFDGQPVPVVIKSLVFGT